MNDKPNTFAISRTEWRALFLQNIQEMVHFVSGTDVLTAANRVALTAHLDRLKIIGAAWSVASYAEAPSASAPAAPVDVPAETPAAPEAPQAQEKRKPGWPKGKKRTKKQVVPE
ncbi:hypothetical protein [Bradyrhizobium cenepequi]|uniref:hypothetical protein n=1 Tax=Bradyrhizobium cenepequi TaxID=2821403 RepID=UPI001CE31089|nr:hypothetical protein [Bradyrhizobium cenepequi]MCA6108121.1 hypothetical protein [Bradyrhizobium cenepequi]